MLPEDKNIKDPLKDTTSLSAPYQATGFGSGSYTKTHKLITALYMVTDIIDKDEPIRNKLRTLGTGIISDMHSVPTDASGKIAETVSFLNIASAMNFISEMNCTILKKEFLELGQSIKESSNKGQILDKPINLTEFFTSPPVPLLGKKRGAKGGMRYQGHTRIGVQKGSTLMRALSDKNLTDTFNLKSQRRADITNIIKATNGNATIKDIKNKIQEIPEQARSLVSCSEKTLQRELISMVRDSVLNKTGERRWSRYFLPFT